MEKIEKKHKEDFEKKKPSEVKSKKKYQKPYLKEKGKIPNAYLGPGDPDRPPIPLPT